MDNIIIYRFYYIFCRVNNRFLIIEKGGFLMKARFTKRVLSVILCTLMLFSCWVFTGPTEVAAADTWTNVNSSVVVVNGSSTAHTGTSALSSSRTGQYRVRLLIKEVATMDKTVHDRPGGVLWFGAKDYPYEPGLAFGTNSQRNLTGTSISDDKGTGEVSRDSSLTSGKYWCEYAKITYKTLNGSSSGGDGIVWFNVGDQDGDGRQDGVSSGTADYGYYPSQDGVVIDGFPTSFTTRYYSTSNLSKNKTYYTVWLQVAKWTSDNAWTWSEDTCPTNDNSLDSKYQSGIATANGATDASEVKEVKATATVDESKLPYATTGTASTNTTTAKTTAPTVKFTTLDSTAQVSSVSLPKTSGSITRRVYYTDVYDQYGAKMSSTIQLKCSNSGKKSYFSQSGTTTTLKYGANIAGTVNTQKLCADVAWPTSSSTGTALSKSSNELTVNDAQYTVKFKDSNGNYIQDGNNGDYTESVYYGCDATAPASPAKDYTPSVHYTFSSWNPSDTNVTSDRDCIPQYTSDEHDMVDDDDVEGYVAATCTEAGVQTKKCSGCEYTTANTPIQALGHSWGNAKLSSATDNNDGYLYYQCSRCEKYCAASYDANNAGNDDNGYSPNESIINTQQSSVSSGATVPAPKFNDDNGAAQFYDGVTYSDRPASFKYDSSTDFQTMRFAGSVKIPEGISEQIGSQDDNVVTDFGFVYTQTKYICDVVNNKYQVQQTVEEVFDDEGTSIGEYSYLEYPTADSTRLVYDFENDTVVTGTDNIGQPGYKVYKMSVVNPEANTTQIANGYSFYDKSSAGSDARYFSFNLVISVKQANWEKEYSARPYIRYKYHGKTYTVYDGGASAGNSATDRAKYSHRSVLELADDMICFDPFDEEYRVKAFVNGYYNANGIYPDYATYLLWVDLCRQDKEFAQNKFYNLDNLSVEEQDELINIKFFSIGWITSFDIDYFLDPDESESDYKGESWYNNVLDNI